MEPGLYRALTVEVLINGAAGGDLACGGPFTSHCGESRFVQLCSCQDWIIPRRGGSVVGPCSTGLMAG